ncbi:MAG TPA: DUF6134 family protein [Stellaceae bacterium]|jgi:hypothetical protein|nr:DUF6134 family protein [Stellaceae bacterium]
MTRARSLSTAAAFVLAFALCAFAQPARADTQIYQYEVEHPTFGNIGTYTNVVDQSGGRTHVESVLHVAVRLLGIVVYRQDATRSEEWRNGRLIAFHGDTTTNGTSVEISGEARGNAFVITTPDGTTVAPADVRTSNPWSSRFLNAHVMMSTKSGRTETVRISGGNETAVTFDGTTRLLRQYLIDGQKRGVVWLDDHGVPIAFKVWEDGTPIELVLISPAIPLRQTAMSAH